MITTCQRMGVQQQQTPQSWNAREILFIDAAVTDYLSLLSQVRSGIEIVVLDAAQNGIEQISQILESFQSITALHLVSHGQPGALQLGNISLNANTLSFYAPQLQQWAKALTAQAELLIYGCEVAQGTSGEHFVLQLSELTGARVAASNTLTGSAQRGGDWNLQVQTGKIRTALAFQPHGMMAYDGILAAGDLDATFSGDGIVITDLSTAYERARSVLVQPDGKIVVVGEGISGSNGDFAIVRYNADGSLDTSFGGGTGRVFTNLAGGDDAGLSVALQADGKLVVAGSSGSDFALARYNSDGSLDNSFNGAGKIVTSFTAFDDVANSVLVQSDGKIVVAGTVGIGSSNPNFGLVRYNADGTLDLSFGGGTSKVVTDFTGLLDQGFSVKAQADGKLIVAGYTNTGSGGQNFNFALTRYNVDGSLDTSFGGLGSGKVTTDLIGFGGEQDIGRSVVVQPDGKILVGGFTYIGSGRNFALTRYNADGSLDNSFGIGGRATADFSDFSSFDVGYSIALQSNGKIVLAGHTNSNYAGAATNDTRFAVMRFNTDGAIDASFGNNGRVATNLIVGTGAAGNDIAYGVTIQSDGKIVVAGEAAGRFAVTRYLGDAVAAVNQPPVATDDSFTTDEDTPLTIAAVDLLSNDTDPNSDPLTITATTAPTNGTLVDNGDGTYTYTPNANFSGTDSFTYTISDGLGGNSIATVNLTINEVAEEIIGTPGNDILTGTEEPDIIRALAGNDIIQGLGGDDLIFGDEGDDRIDGGAGNDTMNGGAGNDTYTVDSTGDVVIETVGNGNNDLVRSSVSWTLGDNVESLTLLGTAPLNGTGNALNNRILGNSAANTLTGNDGNDTLDGKGGNDILLGGNGVDRIIGGAGNDQITSGARGDDLSGNAGQDLFIFVDAPIGSFDTIRDFTPTDDTLQISRSAFGLSLPLGTIPVSALALGTSASLASERFVYDQGSGNLFFDEDGVGGTTQVQIAKLTNRPTTFSNSDIVVIA